MSTATAEVHNNQLYTDEPLGDSETVPDFLPPPDNLVPRRQDPAAHPLPVSEDDNA